MSAPPEAASHPAAVQPSWLHRGARHSWIFQAVILALLAALAAWQIDFKQVGQSFRQADYAWLAVALLLYAFGRLLHAVEWRLCLTKVGFLPFPGLFGAFLIGNFVNAVTIASRFLPERLPPLQPLARLSQRAHDGLQDIWPHLRNGLAAMPFMRVTLHEVVAFRRAATKDPLHHT